MKSWESKLRDYLVVKSSLQRAQYWFPVVTYQPTLNACNVNGVSIGTKHMGTTHTYIGTHGKVLYL